MDNKKVAEVAKEAMLPIAQKLGYDILEVKFGKQFGTDALSVVIDKDEEILIEDCEKLSRAVSDILDEVDPTNGMAYNLNVSSPGIDRPFTTDREFKRNMGKEVEVKLHAPMKGKKIYIGTLKDFNDKEITLKVADEEVKIEKQKIAKITLVIKF